MPFDCSQIWRKLFNLRNVGRPLEASLGMALPPFSGMIIGIILIPFLSISAMLQLLLLAFPSQPRFLLLSIMVNGLGPFPLHGMPSFQPKNSPSQVLCLLHMECFKTPRPSCYSLTWHKRAGFPRYIPKHSFLLWMAIRAKLRTKDKLQLWGIIDNATCMCSQAEETLYLYFVCPFSREVWNLSLIDVLSPEPLSLGIKIFLGLLGSLGASLGIFPSLPS